MVNKQPSVSEQQFFTVPAKDRRAVQTAFISHASGQSNPLPPYHRFDIARSHREGLERLKRTRQDIVENIYATRLDVKRSNLSSVEAQLLYDKNRENLTRIELVERAIELQRNPSPSVKTAFTKLNHQLYGSINADLFWALINKKTHYDNDLIKELGAILRKKYAPIFQIIPDDPTLIYRAYAAKPLLSDVMQMLGFGSWRVTVSDKVMVVNANSTKHRLRLPINFSRSASGLRRLAVHEIGVHTARSVNGAATGVAILEHGTAGYLRAEEGLASLLECAAEGTFNHKSYRRLAYRYITAGLAAGVDGTKRNAEEVYQIIAPMLLEEYLAENPELDNAAAASQAAAEAYTYIENAFRGTDWQTRGMVYLKCKIYYEGLIDNLQYFAANRDNLERALDVALAGKYGHTNLEEVKNIALVTELHQATN